ncbi:hypothetical protein B0F87_11342 [Methylobacter tundripaludum]|uniref:Novel STAND NTPase 1 domain-containing protein n=1 Tax=Methylobacter tundripaludum TaxID=173365 RepID=A0A2S6H925_9GAMM|nr:hypothetical protein [Methylobacter tundripaludum]PPK73931.1 hypothetical protein B0F87_11342 [Methylobacter tundripaludum]
MDENESLDALFADLGADTKKRHAPFMFLDAYGPDDRTIFFGRDSEIRDLYACFYDSRVLLVYGESGTGKTSLIECGLRNEIPLEEALFVTVRLPPDPLAAVRRELERIPGVTTGEGLGTLIGEIIERKSKSLVLVFDQFEEFFLLLTEALRETFYSEVKSWLDHHPKLHLVVALRQEYLAYADEFQAHWSGYCSAKLWVRRLEREIAKSVITGPCAVCGVEVEKSLPERLLADLGAEDAGVELPILQVVLDKLYQKALAENPEQPRLTLQDYGTLGQARLILARFLEDRLATYGEDAESARQVLKTLVTGEGTRLPSAVVEIAERVAPFGAELSPNSLDALLQRLVGDRILREDPDRHVYELRHDALAQQVRQWLTGWEQELVELRLSLENRLSEYQRRGRLLDADFLASLAPYEARLALRGKTSELVAKSKAEIGRRRRNRYWIIGGVVSAFLLVVLGFAAFSVKEWRETEIQREQAAENLDKAVQLLMQLAPINKSDPLNTPGRENLRVLLEDALRYYQYSAKQQDESTDRKKAVGWIKQKLGIDSKTDRKKDLFRLAWIKQKLGIDSPGAEDDYRKAIDIYKSLVQKNPDNQGYRSDLAACYKYLGTLQLDLGELTAASDSYEKAKELREDLVDLHKGDPNRLEYKSDLAESYNDLGNLNNEVGNIGKAREWHQKAFVNREQLKKNRPDVPEYRANLAETQGNLAWIELLDGRPKEAITAAEHGRKIDPGQILIQINLMLGYLFYDQYDKALEICQDYETATLPEMGGKTFAEVVLMDFKIFRNKRPAHLDMAKIEQHMAKIEQRWRPAAP